MPNRGFCNALQKWRSQVQLVNQGYKKAYVRIRDNNEKEHQFFCRKGKSIRDEFSFTNTLKGNTGKAMNCADWCQEETIR